MTDLYSWLSDPAVVSSPSGGLLPEYCFRYMTSDGLLATVANKGLRMNVWSKMNDPRESKVWSSTGTLRAVGGYTDVEMHQRIDNVLRRSARLLAMTMDRDPTADATPGSLFHRGWGRGPLWAHYGDSHRGICLVVDPAAINEAVDEHLLVKSRRYRNWGRIRYVDNPIEITLTGSFGDQSSLDLALYGFLEGRYAMSDLHMTKATDWAYESELRIALVDRDLTESELDTAVNIPLGNLLAGVIFGADHSAPRVLAAGIQRSLGTDSPDFFQCSWTSGIPRLEPLAI